MKNIRGSHLFRFALIADSHLNPVNEGNTSPWQTNHLANPRNEVVVDAINILNPAFTIHLGDVVHPLPYTNSYKKAAEYANSLYLRLNNPLYITPGNHDIGDKCLPGNPAATISKESCNIFEDNFGDQWQSFERDGICFVILNSCLFGSDSEIEDRQWKWFDETLNKNLDKRIILFSHYPPFITNQYEENNYDNIDRVPRERLLAYIEKYNIEAIFSGHVHTFFLNEISNTLAYALPSSTNFRQDYAEVFRVNPAEEFGRNDLGKFGFFVVDVYEEGHLSRFVRTNGSIEMSDAEKISKPAQYIQNKKDLLNLSVDMCHDWCELSKLPYNPPLDAFTRKIVRNDYPILNLWDCGVEHIRIPASDISDDQVWERVQFLSRLGIRFTVFSVSGFSEMIKSRLMKIAGSLHSLEMVAIEPDEKLIDLKISTFDVPIYYAPIYVPNPHKGLAGPFDHTMASGYSPSDLVDGFLAPKFTHSGRTISGIVVRIPLGTPALNAATKINQFSLASGLKIIVNICLLPDKSSLDNNDDEAISRRVVETCFASLMFPNIHIRLDTFTDVDRGYFLRHGLFDRRHNPRAAGLLIKNIKEAYGGLKGLKVTLLEDLSGEIIYLLVWDGGSTKVQLVDGFLKEIR
jgi:Icc-related predicted phosphoesterase